VPNLSRDVVRSGGDEIDMCAGEVLNPYVRGGVMEVMVLRENRVRKCRACHP